ncbi:phytoene/squalene synthase family protein [Chryseolinea serpens]|uniref:phytoene/squalene synthase family protein n=1 Tax=Chryseolinea serpens TaxID=947013 RepID=UPI000933AE33|nr:FAD-dependent oxidoreductase [Chryseolinea serpens]
MKKRRIGIIGSGFSGISAACFLAEARFDVTVLEKNDSPGGRAMRLGAAFQKINFLRDLQADHAEMGRVYFPGLDLKRFDEPCKKRIEDSIRKDFDEAVKGIKKLPRSARFGVYVAYVYYLALFRKIKNTPSHMVMRSRIRIPKPQKATLLAYSFVKHQLNWL